MSVRERLTRFIEKSGMKNSEFAKAVKLSTATISRYRNGKYENPEKIEAIIESWLEDLEIEKGGWADTHVSRQIHAVLRYAKIRRMICVIQGIPGVGKTRTAERYRDQMPNVWYIYIGTHNTTPTGLMYSICRSVGIRRQYHSNLQKKMETICNRLKGTGGLLIFDECQHLDLKTLEMIRTVHDISKIGVAMMGNQHLYDNVRGNNGISYAQLYSRVGNVLEIERPVAGDAEIFARENYGITNKEALKVLTKAGDQQGALRIVENVIEDALLYQDPGTELTGPNITEAYKRVMGGMRL